MAPCAHETLQSRLLNLPRACVVCGCRLSGGVEGSPSSLGLMVCPLSLRSFSLRGWAWEQGAWDQGAQA